MIDGVTSDAGDGGTYAQQLADALTARLETDDDPLPDVLARAIHGVAHVMTDERLESVGTELRQRYRERLAAGHGYDDEHARILCELRAEERRHRNRDGGYWIVSANPAAARRALTRHVDSPAALQLFTDGLVLDDVVEAVSANAVIRGDRSGEGKHPSPGERQGAPPFDDATVILARAWVRQGQR